MDIPRSVNSIRRRGECLYPPRQDEGSERRFEGGDIRSKGDGIRSKEMAHQIRALARLQAALELHDKTMAETFFQDCVKGKSKFAEVDD